MLRTITSAILLAAAAVVTSGSAVQAADISGVYLETRTCQVYTGPCFANGEVGLAGKDAIMAWGIEEGSHEGVDLAGLNVIMVLNASDTLGFGGLDDARELKTLVLVDQRADQTQQAALVNFVKQQTGRAGEAVVRIQAAPISMSLDQANLEANLQAGDDVKVATRKARPSDCICSNESAYYPPLAEVTNFAPGVTTEGEWKGRGLGTSWSTPGARSAYMGTFAYQN